MRYLVMIPARGGSKGVAKKNIYPICGHPMIFYTLNLLMNVDFDGDVLVSTDDEEIIRVSEKIIGKRENYFVVKRPDEYATDESSTEVVAEHALKFMKETYGKEYDVLLTMAPNLPVRSKDMFTTCINEFEKMDRSFDSQVCFCKSDEDLWQKMADGEFVRLFPNAPRRRQDRTPLYLEKGSITMTKVEAFKRTGSLWGNKIHGFEMDEKYGVDVHDEMDIKFLEFLLPEINRRESDNA